MTTPANKYEELLTGISEGGAQASTANRPTGKYYGVPDDYVPLPRGQSAPGASYAPVSPTFTTATDDDRRILRGLPAEQLYDVQQALREAGLIGATTAYRKGVVDEVTREAFGRLLGFANQEGLADWRQALVMYASAPKDEPAKDPVTGMQYQTRLNQYERTDPARIRLTTEAAFAEALGRDPRPDEMARFLRRFQNAEFSAQRQGFTAQDNLTRDALNRDALANGLPGVGQGEKTVDEFMSALSGQESGGDYGAKNGRTGASGKFQIMPGNWAPWAREAGLGPNAAKTPENQDRVARFKLQQYKEKFGTWDAVAVAWYAGPGAVEGFLRNPNDSKYTRKQGRGNEPSIREYVESVRSKLGGTSQPATNADSGEAELAARLQRMMADAPGSVKIGNQRRTRAEQQRLYDLWLAGKGARAAKPGTSKHESGEAADLQYGDESTRQWVLDNAHRYGLVLPVSGEKWHVEVARGQKAKFGPLSGQSVGAVPLPAQPTGGSPGVPGGPPISTSISVTQPDLGAQAVEYARNVNPAETAGYDIGTQFQNLIGILGKGVA